MPQETPVVEKPKNPTKKRYIILGICLGIILLFFLFFLLRGSLLVDTTERNPSTREEGVVTQLYWNSEGKKVTRAAMLVNGSAEDIFSTITDYEHFTQLFPILTSVKYIQQNHEKYRVQGDIQTWMGNFSFDSSIQHSKSQDKYVVSWEGAGNHIKINKGRWELIKKGENQTLVVYSIELRIKFLPTFVVRNVLLSKLKTILLALREKTEQKKTSNK